MKASQSSMIWLIQGTKRRYHITVYHNLMYIIYYEIVKKWWVFSLLFLPRVSRVSLLSGLILISRKMCGLGTTKWCLCIKPVRTITHKIPGKEKHTLRQLSQHLDDIDYKNQLFLSRQTKTNYSVSCSVNPATY